MIRQAYRSGLSAGERPLALFLLMIALVAMVPLWVAVLGDVG